MTLEEGRKNLRRIVDQLETARCQLLGIERSLPEPAAEKVRLEDVEDDMDATTKLQTAIRCVLEDSMRPALRDLQDALASTGDRVEGA